MIWTSRDRDVDWVRGLDQLREPDRAPARRRNRQPALPPTSPFAEIETASFTYAKTMGVDDLVQMVGTYSRIIVASEAERADTLARVRTAIAAHFPGATQVEVPIRSLCWRATRTARS